LPLNPLYQFLHLIRHVWLDASERSILNSVYSFGFGWTFIQEKQNPSAEIVRNLPQLQESKANPLVKKLRQCGRGNSDLARELIWCYASLSAAPFNTLSIDRFDPFHVTGQ
jgi:hypothetical protein